MVSKTKRAKKSTSTTSVDVEQLKHENEILRKELASAKSAKTKRTYSLWRPFFAGLCAVLAVTSFALFNISYWTKETVVNTDQFVETMQPLIKDPQIQKTLQTEITDQVFSQIDLEAELKKALPENVAFIAAPLAGQVESFTFNKIGDVLNSDQADQVWVKTLTVGHAQIISYIEDPNNSGEITVNSIYTLAGEQLKTTDVGFLFGKTLPEQVGNIQLAEIDGVPEARQAINILRETTLALGIASIVFTVLALALSPRRRNMVIGLAVFTLLFMLSTIAALTIAGSQVASSTSVEYAAAAEATYNIITAPLLTQTQGVAALIGAAIVVAIVSSSWKYVLWARTKLRQGLDWAMKMVLGNWGGAGWLGWISSNRIVICWTLVGVSFAAFALRLPPTVSGVKQALIASALAAFALEVASSISRVTKK